MRAFGWCLVLALVWPVTVVAQAPESAQVVIRAQLQAFSDDNAEHAFSYAADGIKQQFGNAERFARMVRSQYPALYRPRHIAFVDPVVVSSEQMYQEVSLVDGQGRGWRAVYSLISVSGEWRIDGVAILRAPQLVL
ncbi:DUF4864 domain-containing protein [Salinispirillum sp. LH 10-3-1]|uniref:DUF4864 domain-containing protein n=1 Tax=Salinispirillum sp. LH 10-3-1 TaxID=2952525 RepID=A0AB38YEB3_9GAMM